MGTQTPFDFSDQLKDDETLLWTGRGSGRNLNRKILFPMITVSVFGLFLVLGFPLSGFQTDMALVALLGLAVSAIVIWFFRARMLSPSSEEYAVTSQRILIVSGPIGRICRSYYPRCKRQVQKRVILFHGIKLVRKRGTVVFLTVRSRTAPQGHPPIFVGIADAEQVARLAAETFAVKLIQR